MGFNSEFKGLMLSSSGTSSPRRLCYTVVLTLEP